MFIGEITVNTLHVLASLVFIRPWYINAIVPLQHHFSEETNEIVICLKTLQILCVFGAIFSMKISVLYAHICCMYFRENLYVDIFFCWGYYKWQDPSASQIIGLILSVFQCYSFQTYSLFTAHYNISFFFLLN